MYLPVLLPLLVERKLVLVCMIAYATRESAIFRHLKFVSYWGFTVVV
jgi:hypothetical protein